MQNCKHKDCFYRRKNNGNGEETCDYLIIVGQSRGCPAGDCDKYKPKPESVRKRFNHMQKEG